MSSSTFGTKGTVLRFTVVIYNKYSNEIYAA